MSAVCGVRDCGPDDDDFGDHPSVGSGYVRIRIRVRRRRVFDNTEHDEITVFFEPRQVLAYFVFRERSFEREIAATGN